MARRTAAAAVLLLTALATLSWDVFVGADRPQADVSAAAGAGSSRDQWFLRACAQADENLIRIWHGYDPARSEDVTFVPVEPNYLGTFNTTSHSGPADYLQTVPLVLYGPETIESAGIQYREVTLADVYGTVESLFQIPLATRPGGVLDEALIPEADPPKLLVVVVWDGAGRNVLERWPDAWPFLESLERDGTSYRNATVGSSPSITPTTHATLGTGTFPRRHRISAIQYRKEDGSIGVMFAKAQPSQLKRSTFADQIDIALDNEPKVGLIGWRGWHIGMLGHGALYDKADRDHVGLIGYESRVFGNNDYFETPEYLHGFPGLGKALDDADALDGVRDGLWMGHPVIEDHDNPGWVMYETAVVKALMRRERYGIDEVPDIMLVNYKMTDIAGHRYSMDSIEEEGVLQAQDQALEEFVAFLDKNVGDYALVVTADHGHTPAPETNGGWPIIQREMERDLNAHFGIQPPESLSQATTSVGVFLDAEVMSVHKIGYGDIAVFFNRYRIRDNWTEDTLPEDYRLRGGEMIFQAAWPTDRLPEVMRCAFGDDFKRL